MITKPQAKLSWAQSLASRRSIAILILAWLALQFGGIFSPGLLDDVDSVYIEIAREMLHRHDFVTPYIDGIRFFDKPPLMYWLAAGSMRVFGESDWAARLPLCLAILALFLAIYTLGLRLYSERGAFYSALIFATAIGPYLYTRFFIPDLLICLWMTLGVHCFLTALERIGTNAVILSEARSAESKNPDAARITTIARPFSTTRSALLPCVGFAATLALNLLTKGLIGLVFPLGFVLIYLAVTHQLRLLLKLHLIASTAVFLAIALPWHILAALRNPAIAMPAGLGLPPHAGWAWFYLYNEHIARFLGKRIPQDYGNTPIPIFWLYALIWIMPWGVMLPAAIEQIYRQLRGRLAAINEAALTTALWSLLVLVFFSVSHRQEYYSLPAMPALALMIGGVLARADEEHLLPISSSPLGGSTGSPISARPLMAVLACHRWLLLPIACLVAATCGYLALIAPAPMSGSELATVLANNPELYNVSLGHLFDLRFDAMGFFRTPLVVVTVGMVILGPISYGLRRRSHTYSANLTLATGMIICLLAAHEGLVRFNPILGSKPLAEAIVTAEQQHPEAENLIVLDGELTSGSTLLFYTRQPVHLVNGRINGPWFGSFWPDAPPIFETEATLRKLWAGPNRVFLMTPVPASRIHNLEPFGPVQIIASAGGKTILTNR
jgi:4-amino-4-deoxy-L-arabinose transferase-like glycosyltransferase